MTPASAIALFLIVVGIIVVTIDQTRQRLNRHFYEASTDEAEPGR